SGSGDTLGGGALYVAGTASIPGRVQLNNVSMSGDTADTVGSDIAVGNGGSVAVESANFGMPAAPPDVIDVATGGAITLAPHAGEVISIPGPLNAAPIIGNGTVVLNAASTFAGVTNVSGVLELAANGAAGTSTIALNGGAQLKIDAAVTTLGNT